MFVGGQSETFKTMERRLLHVIINPAMIVAWLLGLWLAWHGPDSHSGWFASGWLQAKFALVLVLSALQSRRYKEQLDQALAYIEGVERGQP